ncbi:MAG: LptF/LptG family permease [Endomicrobiales bacterium]|nr:LptF/LptG family permease [Endomicrobiales bacterium]
MKIITRYIIKEYLKPFLLSALSFGGLVLISEFFRELNYYMEKKAAITDVFEYLLFNLPWWIIQVLPVAVLLAVLFSLGGLVKRGEIIALKASGVNLWKIIIIYLSIALVIVFSDIILREKVIPYAVKRAEKVRTEKINKKKVQEKTEYRNIVVSLPNNGRMTVSYLDAKEGNINRVIIDYYDDDFNLINQVVSEKGYWQNDTWILENGIQRVFTEKLFEETRFDQKEVSLPFKPKDFVYIKLRPEQMSTKDYKNYIKQLQILGIPEEKDVIRLYTRWSSVFSHIIVMLIAIPFAFGLGKYHSKVISFTFALIFAFVYWGVQAMGQSLGENGVISPLLSAWLGNIMFGIIGLVLIGRVRK